MIKLITEECKKINKSCCYETMKDNFEGILENLKKIPKDKDTIDIKLFTSLKNRVNLGKEKDLPNYNSSTEDKSLLNYNSSTENEKEIQEIQEIQEIYGFDIVACYVFNEIKENYGLNRFVEEQKITTLEKMKQIDSFIDIEIDIMDNYFKHIDTCKNIKEDMDIFDVLKSVLEKLSTVLDSNTFNKNTKEIILKTSLFSLIDQKSKDKITNSIEIDFETIIEDTKDGVINYLNIFKSSNKELLNRKIESTCTNLSNNEVCKILFITTYEVIIYFSFIKILSFDNNLKRNIKNSLSSIKKNIDLSVTHNLVSAKCIDNEKFINILNFIGIKNKGLLNFFTYFFENYFGIKLDDKKFAYIRDGLKIKMNAYNVFKLEMNKIYKK